MEFSGPSYVRFHRRLQTERAIVFSVSFVIVLVLKWVGQVDFNFWGLFATVAFANVSALLFSLGYRSGVEERWGIKLFPAWMALDVIIISSCIYQSGDPYTLWFMWYLVNVAAAAFSQGARAALIVGALNTVAYIATFLLMVGPDGLSALPPILGRILMLYGLSFFPMWGISDLRRRRLVIKDLIAEKTRHVETLTRMTHDLNQRTEELVRANDRITEADRLKSRFLANMSHELRTPLNAIIGFSDVLLSKAADRLEERHQAFLRNIHTSGDHLLDLVNDLLDLSKIEAGKMELILEDVDILGVAQGVKSVMAAEAQKQGHEIYLQIPDEMPKVHVDAPKLKQILFNLVSNAVKYSPDGGRVIVVARLLSAEQSVLGCDSFEIKVSDRGTGIAPEELGWIFEEFYRVDSEQSRHVGGTGLGLALVKRLCALQGGTITVESVLGEGSTFTVALPRTVSDELMQAREIGDRPFEISSDRGFAEEGERPKVLVVEDDVETSRRIARELALAGFLPIRARHGEEALRLAKELMPAAITLDIVIPGLDGWEVLTELKRDKTTSGIPVIIISSVDNRELGVALGADDYFTKPIDGPRLRERLRDLVGETDDHVTPVLLIDDDPDVHELIVEHLAESEFSIVSADSGPKGLEFAREQPFGAIVLDLMMPEMNGFEVSEALKIDERTREIPIIVLTSHSLTNADRNRLSGRITSLLQKEPGQSRRLVDALRQVINAPH